MCCMAISSFLLQILTDPLLDFDAVRPAEPPFQVLLELCRTRRLRDQPAAATTAPLRARTSADTHFI